MKAKQVITKTKSTPKAVKEDKRAWEEHPMTQLLGILSKDKDAQVAELEGLLRRRK